jgi:hypothetical protein
MDVGRLTEDLDRALLDVNDLSEELPQPEDEGAADKFIELAEALEKAEIAAREVASRVKDS